MMFVPVFKLQGYHHGWCSHHHHHPHNYKILGVSCPPHIQRIRTACTSASSPPLESEDSSPIISASGVDVTTIEELLHAPSSTLSFPSISSISSISSSPPSSSSSSPQPTVDSSSLALQWTQEAETGIEKAIFNFRFLSLLAVSGSLAGSFLCFLKGCVYIKDSYAAFYEMCTKNIHTGMMVLRLVEAVDVYLTGTVMLIFGMGLYGLFISNIPNNLPPNEDRALRNSSLFGMFLLRKRPKWMRIASLDELKTKLGHVVVMILLVKMFERSKAVSIATSVDLLSYSISIFLISSALLVLRNISHH